MSRSTVEAFNQGRQIDFDEITQHQRVLIRVPVSGQEVPTILMGNLTGATAEVQNRLYVRLLDDDEIVSVHIDEIRAVEAYGPKQPGGSKEPEKISEVFKRLAWYAVPVCTLGNLRVDWRVVIAESEEHALDGVADEIEENEQHHLFVSTTYKTRWLAPANDEDVDARKEPKPVPLVHGIDFHSHDVGCGVSMYEEPLPTTFDNDKITCEPCRKVLIRETGTNA